MFDDLGGSLPFPRADELIALPTVVTRSHRQTWAGAKHRLTRLGQAAASYVSPSSYRSTGGCEASEPAGAARPGATGCRGSGIELMRSS